MIGAKTRAKALDLLRTGCPQREVARRCKISKGAVSQLAKSLRSEEPTEPEAPALESAGTPRPSATAGARAEDLTRFGVDHALQMAERATADGNTAAAAKFIRDAIGGANNLARIERSKRDGEERFYTAEECEAAKRKVMGVIALLCADVERTGGLVCRKCGSEIRIALARGDAG